MRAVDRLLAEKQLDAAELLAMEGLAKVDTYQKMVRAAKKARCENQVTKAAMPFLETGQRPDHGIDGSPKSQVTKAWPLPQSPVSAKGAGYPRSSSIVGPHHEVLIDLAIAQQQADEVLKWYDQRRTALAGAARDAQVRRGDVKIAPAVEQSPEQAIEIYLQLVACPSTCTFGSTGPLAATKLI